MSRYLPLLAAAAACASIPAIAAQEPGQQIERWNFFELRLPGPSAGNPFTEVRFSAEFRYQQRTIEIPGFYDGDGAYVVRFMPDEVGEWSYTTHSRSEERRVGKEC